MKKNAKKISKQQEDYDKRQGRARRRIEIMQELKALGLNPFTDKDTLLR
ncbi:MULTISPECIES: hypothetical protein [Vibrio harveyi group]|jgi:hypothetical protein|nr:hypothetical protein [Vibrio parahaemolyticus]